MYLTVDVSVSLDDSSQDASSQDDSQTSISGEQDSIVEVSVPNSRCVCES